MATRDSGIGIHVASLPRPAGAVKALRFRYSTDPDGCEYTVNIDTD